MTIREFEKLSEQDQKIYLFEAKKVTERLDGYQKFELFSIGDFFVEAKTSNQHQFKRMIYCYSLGDLPVAYGACVH